MDPWSELCRCCLSSEYKVSLLDEELNVKERFFEVTSIEVEEDDGLPQKLCEECYTTMNSAYQFRQQCIKMNNELKNQQEKLLMQSTYETTKPEENTNQNSSDDVFGELMSLIKTEPSDSDDDCYYVLVIDDPKDQETNEEKGAVGNVKEEHIKPEVVEDKEPIEEDEEQQTFENIYDSFLNTKVPVNVPATILENEESQEMEVDDLEMNDNETKDNITQEPNLPTVDDFQDKIEVEISGDINEMPNKENIIKLLTKAGADGTIVLKGDDGIQYLTDTHLITNDDTDDEGDANNQEHLIFCDSNNSQFQILKCDSSELVIQYADEDQIATVFQQDDGTFMCDCGQEFEDLQEYEKHQHKHNPAGEHLCNLCGKGFESAEILNGHMLLHKVSGPLVQCPFCDQHVRRNALTQHIKYGHQQIKPQCSICQKTFANPNNLKRHMMIHSGIREFECNICSRRFHQKITMQTHRLTHMNPFACNECDNTFENKAGVVEHKESNKCSKSRVKQVKEELLKTIKQEVTTNLGKLLGFACSLCKKMFSLESALEQHVESTHLLDPADLLCPECGEVVPSKKDMQTHLSNHKHYRCRNMKKFECSECGKGCASQAMLIMHERVHTNERPFPCGLCSLRFKTKTHLRTHQLTHTREKKFGCSICMKFFALKGNLVVHLRTHTGERPYVCTLCGDAFIDSKYLKKHKLKKHAIENVPWNQY